MFCIVSSPVSLMQLSKCALQWNMMFSKVKMEKKKSVNYNGEEICIAASMASSCPKTLSFTKLTFFSSHVKKYLGNR